MPRATAGSVLVARLGAFEEALLDQVACAPLSGVETECVPTLIVNIETTSINKDVIQLV